MIAPAAVPLLQGPLLHGLRAGRPRFLAPEVIQSSGMDCGPAVLKALLAGHGVDASYRRLREACQTDLDGTSLDVLEELSNRLGVEAEQIMLPPDHVFAPGSRMLPAIVVVRRPRGGAHFVLAWRQVGRYVQVMDPGSGRRWSRCDRFARSLYLHSHAVPAGAWRQWAGGEESLRFLDRRLKDLGAGAARRQRVLDDALADTGWTRLAGLEASLRLVAELVAAGAIRRGRAALALLHALDEKTVPERYWSVRPSPAPTSSVAGTAVPRDGGASSPPQELLLRGAVLVVTHGRRRRRAAVSRPTPPQSPLDPSGESLEDLGEPEVPPGRGLLELLREDGLLTHGLLAAGLFSAAMALMLEALLLRGLLEVGERLPTVAQRLGFLAAAILFCSGLLLTDLSLAAGLHRLGRRLEVRLRLAFLRKLPRLGGRYFRSRSSSDLAQRSHAVHRLRTLAPLGGLLLRDLFALLLVAGGIAWLDPRSAPLAFAAAGLVVVLPLAAQRCLAERDLEVRSHGAALARSYLDALLGLVPVRNHAAERSLRRLYETRCNRWARAAFHHHRGLVVLQGMQLVVGYGFAAWLVCAHLARQGVSGTSLLLLYWALRLPALGAEIVHLAGRYPSLRNVALRLMEPLRAVEEDGDVSETDDEAAGEATGGALETPAAGPWPWHSSTPGAEIRCEGVSVNGVGGRRLLEAVGLDLPAGSHTAIVGRSGAGKSTLVATLLGLHPLAAGRILVDGELVRGRVLRDLRGATAWVDRSTQLWNRTLHDNLTYGLGAPVPDLTRALRQVDLLPLLEKLPDGLGTQLGEGGRLVSGGEGQRIRLARALLRPGVRLVLLDEALRDLHRSARGELLARCREHWAKATLVCVTHDLWQTTDFDRVVVIENGRLVELGAPRVLCRQEGSLYRDLLAEEEHQRQLWDSPAWRRLQMNDGRLRESA